jgi:hypothetical protein
MRFAQSNFDLLSERFSQALASSSSHAELSPLVRSLTESAAGAAFIVAARAYKQTGSFIPRRSGNSRRWILSDVFKESDMTTQQTPNNPSDNNAGSETSTGRDAARREDDEGRLEKMAKTIAPPSREVSDAELIDPGANAPAPKPATPAERAEADRQSRSRPR